MDLKRFFFSVSLALFLAGPTATAETPQQLRPLALVDLPGIPGFDEVVFANGDLVLTHNSMNTLDVIDPVKRRMVAQIKGIDSPRGLAVDAAGGLLYVAGGGNNTIKASATNLTGTAFVIDLQKKAVAATVANVGIDPYGVAILDKAGK